MQFKEFDWLSGHGMWAIIPCPTNMVSVRVNFLGAFLFPFQSSFPRFWGVFNKTIIPLALVGYEMNIANEARSAELAMYHLTAGNSERKSLKTASSCPLTVRDLVHLVWTCLSAQGTSQMIRRYFTAQSFWCTFLRFCFDYPKHLLIPSCDNFKTTHTSIRALYSLRPQHLFAPSYIRDLLTPYGPSHQIRSSSKNLLVIPHFNLKTYGARYFSVAAPTLRNTLPSDIMNSSSVSISKTNLKLSFLKKHCDSLLIYCSC